MTGKIMEMLRLGRNLTLIGLLAIQAVYGHGFDPQEGAEGAELSRDNEPMAAREPNVSNGELNEMVLLDDRRKLNVGDRLNYRVIEEERAEPQVLFVNAQGNVYQRLFGTIPAEGKTCQEIAFDIKKELEKEYFKQATVLINFRDGMNSRGTVHLVGEVKKRGELSLPPDRVLTVYNAISKVGITERAKAGAVIISRGEKKIRVDVAKMLEEGPGEDDIALQPGDVVQVPAQEASARDFTVVGAIKQSGVYEIPRGKSLTVNEAILKAGGFTEFANRSRVKVIRSTATESGDKSSDQSANGQSPQTFIVNVAAVQRGQLDEDMEVKPGDFIRVPEGLINFSN